MHTPVGGSLSAELRGKCFDAVALEVRVAGFIAAQQGLSGCRCGPSSLIRLFGYPEGFGQQYTAIRRVQSSLQLSLVNFTLVTATSWGSPLLLVRLRISPVQQQACEGLRYC